MPPAIFGEALLQGHHSLHIDVNAIFKNCNAMRSLSKHELMLSAATRAPLTMTKALLEILPAIWREFCFIDFARRISLSCAISIWSGHDPFT